MRTSEQLQTIKDYEEDIKDCKKAIVEAENDAREAMNWWKKQLNYHLELEQKLNDYLKSIENSNKPL